MPKLGDLLPKQVRRDLVDTIGEPAMTYPKVEFVHWMDREAQAIADEAVRRFPDQPDGIIMDPHIVRKFRQGIRDASACTSCDKCRDEMRRGRMRCVLL